MRTTEHAGHTYEDQMLSGIDDRVQFRVWPDGTVQCVEDGPPHSHLSDDYQTVLAMDEDEALTLASRSSSR